MTSIELWLLRHGHSTGNRDEVRQGQGDYPLTDPGKRQVQVLADDWLAQGLEFDAIFASPLERARSSADLIAQTLSLEDQIELDARWMERRAGEAEGKAISEESAWRGKPHATDAHLPPFAGAESRMDLHIRATDALQSILRRGPGRYLVVAHGGILGSAIRALLRISPSGRGLNPTFAFRNCGYAVVRYDTATGSWNFLKFINPAEQEP